MATAGWDLETLTLVAFYYHPDMDVARARVGMAEAGIVTAGGRPSPSVGFQPRFNVDAPAGKSPWTFGLTFDLPLETAGKRGYRIARAQALTEAARIELAETGWRVRRRVRAALAEYFLARFELELLRAEEEVHAEGVAVLGRRLALGFASRPEVDVAQADLASTQLALRSAEGRLNEGRATLADALGLPLPAIEGACFTWPGLDQPSPAGALSPAAIQWAALLNRLDLRRALAGYAAAEAALQLEVARQYPDIRLSPGYLFEEGDNKYSLGFFIALPLFNRNEGPIAEAEARRKEEAARFLALQAQVIGEAEQALAHYRATLAALAQADAALVISERREQAMRRAVTVGEEDRLALVGVRAQYTVAHRTRLEALRRVQTALGALEDVLQRPLDPGLAVPPVPPVSPRDGLRTEGRR